VCVPASLAVWSRDTHANVPEQRVRLAAGVWGKGGVMARALRSQLPLRRMLLGLRSRCSTLAE
jgi:hypothetical protein